MMTWVHHFGSTEGSPWLTAGPSNPSLGHHLYHRMVIDLITKILNQKKKRCSHQILFLRNMALTKTGLSLLNGSSLEGTVWPLTEIFKSGFQFEVSGLTFCPATF